MKQRQPAVSGLFYPSRPDELSRRVNNMLTSAERSALQPKALIAPHAGYVYSGPIAASAYRCLEPIKDKIKHVVLLGPSHRVPFSGVATPGCDAFFTPLGAVPLDKKCVDEAEKSPHVTPLPIAHAAEHSLEVHLPFLQTVFNDFSVLPLLVGDISANKMADVIARAWKDDNTLVVVSSDLSHYLTYEKAKIKDRNTTASIENLNANLDGAQACGCRPVNGLITLCRRENLRITNIDLRNSGDTAGKQDQVVGYGAYVVH